jgi:hypothetical protein
MWAPSEHYSRYEFPKEPTWISVEHTFGRTLRERGAVPHPPVVFWIQGELSVGWPWHALRQRYQSSGLDGLPAEITTWSDGARELECNPDHRRCLNGFMPVRPVPGFALDTAFYTALALTLWSAPGLIRRRLRQARGHCPACGYNLKGAPTTTCPECGS